MELGISSLKLPISVAYRINQVTSRAVGYASPDCDTLNRIAHTFRRIVSYSMVIVNIFLLRGINVVYVARRSK